MQEIYSGCQRSVTSTLLNAGLVLFYARLNIILKLFACTTARYQLSENEDINCPEFSASCTIAARRREPM
jgi:hypothetical protein